MEDHIYHLPACYLPDPVSRHNFATRMANLHLAFCLIRRLGLTTPRLIASWDAFQCPYPPFSNPIFVKDWPMKEINNLVVIMETLRNSPGPLIFAAEPGFEEPWALWCFAAALAQTWTRDPYGRETGVPGDIGIEELRKKTEQVYWEVRKVNADIWGFNYAYHWQMVEQRWYDVQTGRMKECYDGGQQDGIGHQESGENGEGDASTTDVEDNDEMAKEVRNDRDCDNVYWIVEEDVLEDGIEADNDDDTSSDDEGVVSGFEDLRSGFQRSRLFRRVTAGPKMPIRSLLLSVA
ncbi:hypothetical protein QBC32DRAFT_375754 [Pseudoneurospora amorphoporcata]|uniref:Uncharacterized protein n=1 Tax=Pseudoneurospora amorphoporcata TaxID=241081 RepID=A0AAN6P1P7_9PEZI|nr:hypothetical protein QBC32DRAFT_375754 [Pseudoneurospora amorphoporcata]